MMPTPQQSRTQQLNDSPPDMYPSEDSSPIRARPREASDFTVYGLEEDVPVPIGRSSNELSDADYPSWLPSRPGPPAPPSSFGGNTPAPGSIYASDARDFGSRIDDYRSGSAMDHSRTGTASRGVTPAQFDQSLPGQSPYDTSRRQTPRGVRILSAGPSLPQAPTPTATTSSRRQEMTTDQTRVPSTSESAFDFNFQGPSNLNPNDAPFNFGVAPGKSEDGKSRRVSYAPPSSSKLDVPSSGAERRASTGATPNRHVPVVRTPSIPVSPTRTDRRVWSRATTAGVGTPTLQGAFDPPTRTGRPRFVHKHTRARSRSRSRSANGKRGSIMVHPPAPASLDHLLSPSWFDKFHYYVILPLRIALGLVLQTFVDGNVLFLAVLLARNPNPAAPGVPGKGNLWTLGAVAYAACWALQIFCVFIMYELIYSFWRRWRVKRPLIEPLYLSAPAHLLVSLTSYTNFCFMRYVSASAWGMNADVVSPEHKGTIGNSLFNGASLPRHGRTGLPSAASPTFSEKAPSNPDFGMDSSSSPKSFSSWWKELNVRDGLAETFYFYAQNLPTVALLLPRVGIIMAILMSYWNPDPLYVAVAVNANVAGTRDGLYFQRNGTLTSYSKGVLLFGAAWAAWRVLVLLVSWIGLWIVSGHTFGGLCGPRYRWQEEDGEKPVKEERSVSDYLERGPRQSIMDSRMSGYSESDSTHSLADKWPWKECTHARIQAAYDFCVAPTQNLEKSVDGINPREMLGPVVVAPAFEGMEQVLAAVGFPSTPHPARRGVLTEDLFAPRESTDQDIPAELQEEVRRAEIVKKNADEMKAARRVEREATAIAVKALREYEEEERQKAAARRAKGKGKDGAPLTVLPYPFSAKGAYVSSQDRVPFPPSPNPSRKATTTSREEDEEEDDDDEEEEDEDEEVTSSGRASGSMSSLGAPVVGRYPFQFRTPTREQQQAYAAASHSDSNSRSQPSTNSRSTQSKISQSTASTGNRESSDSHSPRTGTDSQSPRGSSDVPGPHFVGVPMPPLPMPRRHPRARSGTVPGSPDASSSPPVAFPAGRPRARTRASSGTTEAFGIQYESQYEEELMEQPEAEGPHEALEQEDVLGLLSASPSPKTSLISLRHRRSSNLSRHRTGSANSRSTGSSGSSQHSRSRAGSMSAAARTRAQSLIHSIGHASRSSLDLVRSRANSSMARLEEDSMSGSHSRSASGSGSDVLEGRDHTFGFPLRHEIQDRISEERLSAEDPRPAATTEAPAVPSPHLLHAASSQGNLSIADSAPSERTVEPGAHRLSVYGDAESSYAPTVSAYAATPSMTTISHPDISTAAQSFVTAPATIQGSSDSGGRASSRWGHTLERSEGPWQPTGPA